MLILGIDEAGRGCILGPLVLGVVLIDESLLDHLAALGVTDSKKLSPRVREDLAPRIVEIAASHSLRIVEPARIDEAGLNFLEATEIVAAIREHSPQKAFFDVPTHPSGVANFVKAVRGGVGETVELVGENRADVSFPIVSAASILAKVERDRIIAKLRREYGDFGSGYLSDVKTQDFLREWFAKFHDFPPIVRRRWSSAQRFLVKQLQLLD